MANYHELDIEVQDPKISDESSGKTRGEVIRDYVPVEGVKWRFGTPNYTKVNATYFRHRQKIHAAGSLEEVVTKVVKNWEVESHHIADPAQWTTMDSSQFKISVNGQPSADAAAMAEVGPYNFLLGDTAGFKGSKNTFEEANEIFSSVFLDGFAWEVMEVFSGPPSVSFRWRHFGKFTGTFVDDEDVEHDGDGKMVEVFGFTVAKLDDKLRILALENYMDPKAMIDPLMNAAGGGLCPFACGAA